MFESSLFLWIIVFSLLGSVGAIGGAALILLFPDTMRKRLLPCLLSYATGTLLGAAFLGMIPKSMQQAPPLNISITILAGIVIFSCWKRFCYGVIAMMKTVKYTVKQAH